MIIRETLADNFLMMPGDLLNDPDLSLDAITVMGRLLTLKPEWRVCLQNLRRRWGIGLERLKRIMNELIEAGWAELIPNRRLPDGSYSGGDYKIFNVRQPRQRTLALDEARASRAGAQDQTRVVPSTVPGSTKPESAEPESVGRTPYLDSKIDINPPYPPNGGARSLESDEGQNRGLGNRRDEPESGRMPEPAQGCRGAALPAVPPATVARFEAVPGPDAGAIGAGRTVPAEGAVQIERARRPDRTARRGRPAALEPGTAALFRALIAAYPDGALGNREFDAQAAFAALTEAEQRAAILRAGSYAESLRKRPRHPFSLMTFLRQTDFAAAAAQIARAASEAAARAVAPVPRIAVPAEAPAPTRAPDRPGDWPRGGPVFVAADSPEGRAWEAYCAGFGNRPIWIVMPGKGRGWNMPAPFPPAAAEAA